MNQALISKLESYWHVHEAPVRGGASESEIETFEREHEVQLPVDFRDFLKISNGFVDDEKDEDGFRFWQLNEITSVASYDDGKYKFDGCEDYLVFCDYLDFSWGYAISASSGKVLIIGTANKSPPCSAKSFEEFLGKYISGDDALYAI